MCFVILIMKPRSLETSPHEMLHVILYKLIDFFDSVFLFFLLSMILEPISEQVNSDKLSQKKKKGAKLGDIVVVVRCYSRLAGFT